MARKSDTYPLGRASASPERRRATLGPGRPGLWNIKKELRRGGGRTARGAGRFPEGGENKEKDNCPEETSPRRDIVHHSIWSLSAFTYPELIVSTLSARQMGQGPLILLCRTSPTSLKIDCSGLGEI
jgi:hypothetical protein